MAPVEPEGGDAACWLDRVCDVCGRFVDDARPHECARAELDAPAEREPPVAPGR